MTTPNENVSILRAIFPEWSEEQQRIAQQEFERFFGIVYDDYMAEKRKKAASELDQEQNS